MRVYPKPPVPQGRFFYYIVLGAILISVLAELVISSRR